MIKRRKQYKYIINIPSIEDRLQIMGVILCHLLSKLHIKILARAGPNWGPIATPSVCLWNLFLNIINDCLVAMVIKLRKTSSGILGVLSSSLYKVLMQISMVSYSWRLVNKEWTFRLVVSKLGFCLQISSVKWNEFVTVNLFSVKGV